MPRKGYKPQAKLSLPVSLHQETRLLKKFVGVPEVREELGTLIAKSIATLDWCMENGTPGVKLGAAQTVLQAFVPRAPQVVENLNYDVADLSAEQQSQVLRLAKEYRAIVGSAPEGRGDSAETADRQDEAAALLLDPPDADYNPLDFGPGWEDTPPGPPKQSPWEDPDWREQVGEEYLGDDRNDSLVPGNPSVQEDPSPAGLPPNRHSGPTVPEETSPNQRHAPALDAADVAEGEELDDSVGG